jgi:hypothetical protein
MTPTKRKRAPVEMPWLTICRMAPEIDAGVTAKRPSIT